MIADCSCVLKMRVTSALRAADSRWNDDTGDHEVLPVAYAEHLAVAALSVVEPFLAAQREQVERLTVERDEALQGERDRNWQRSQAMQGHAVARAEVARLRSVDGGCNNCGVLLKDWLQRVVIDQLLPRALSGDESSVGGSSPEPSRVELRGRTPVRGWVPTPEPVSDIGVSQVPESSPGGHREGKA